MLRVKYGEILILRQNDDVTIAACDSVIGTRYTLCMRHFNHNAKTVTTTLYYVFQIFYGIHFENNLCDFFHLMFLSNIICTIDAMRTLSGRRRRLYMRNGITLNGLASTPLADRCSKTKSYHYPG